MQQQQQRTHYRVLGVRPDASVEAIRAAFARKKADDREARDAYETLTDPSLRSCYDAVLLLSNALFGMTVLTLKQLRLEDEKVAARVAVTPRQLLERASLDVHSVVLDARSLVRKSIDARVYRGGGGGGGRLVEVTCIPSDNLYVDMESGDVHVEYYASLCELLAGGAVSLGLPGARLLSFDLEAGGRTKNVLFSGAGVDPGSDLYVHVMLTLPRRVPRQVLETHFAKGDPLGCELIFKQS